MRDHIITFRLNDREMEKLISKTRRTADFEARSLNEAARFIVTKSLGEWYRPARKNSDKSLSES